MRGARTTRRPRVGFVLGGGGMLGGAWLAGALGALHEATGLDPRQADVVIGTSAGSAVGALATSGIEPEYLSAYACGRSLEDLAGPDAPLPATEAAALRDAAVAFRLERALPAIGPGSLRMAVGTLRRPHAVPPTALLAGWLPRGAVSTRPLRTAIGTLVPDWPGDRFWAVACDYRTGRRVAFGSAGAPEARLADAVGASCAIPGFYRPVEIGDRCYVDGGVCSASNLDLVLRAPEPLDLVVCLSPMSSAASPGGRGPADVLGAAMRGGVRRRLMHEARKVRDAGPEVLILEPGADEVRAMGINMMRRSGREEIAELAARTVLRSLRTPGSRAALRAAAVPGAGGVRPRPSVAAVRSYLADAA